MSSRADDKLYNEPLPNIRSVVEDSTRLLFRRETVARKLPILKWLPHYQMQFLLQDFIAGITVGLTTIPQGIAYGVIAGLEPQFGLYSAFAGPFSYIVFGSCKDVTIATTAIMALMVHDYAILNPDYAAFTSFFAGLIILLLGLLNMGVLVRFISIPVITGFTTAAAVTIASAQLNNFVGLKSPSNRLFHSWRFFVTHLPSIRQNDAILGVCTLAFLLIMKRAKEFRFGHRLLWKYLCLARNAIAVVTGTLLAYCLSHDNYEPFRVTGNITAGLPHFRLPPLQTEVNGTVIEFKQMLHTVGPSLATIPLVAILEVVAISKAFSKGKIVDASQEMVALGMCNMAGSLFNSMPVTGSFTRTAVNNASGVKTTLGGAFTGTLVLMALAFLTQTFYYIPKTTLSSIIIAAMISLVEPSKVKDMWQSKKFDICPFLVTALTSLYWSLEYGIIAGIVFNSTFILYKSARPKIYFSKEKINGGLEIAIVAVRQSLDYASAEHMKERILKFLDTQFATTSLVIIKGNEITSIDYTVAVNIISLKDNLEMRNCKLVCLNWSFTAAGVICRLNKELRNMFKFNASIEDAIADFMAQDPNSGSSYTVHSIL